MTVGEILPFALLALIGLGLSAVFSGIETGVYTLNRVRLAVRAGRGESSARRLRDELQHPNRMLSTLLVGNNLANYLGSLGLAAILDRSGLSPGTAVAVNAAVLIPVLFVFGETLPKDLFRTFTDQWTYRWSGVLVLARRFFTLSGLVPLVQFVGGGVARLLGAPADAGQSARVRISQLIQEGTGAGVLSEAQAGLVERGLAMRELVVRDRMVPWRRVARLRKESPYAAVVALARRRSSSRIPIVGADGLVTGVLRLVDSLAEPERPITDLMRRPVELPPGLSALEAIRRLRGARTHLGIVAEPTTRRPLGVVTINDLVDPLAGGAGAVAPGRPVAREAATGSSARRDTDAGSG